MQLHPPDSNALHVKHLGDILTSLRLVLFYTAAWGGAAAVRRLPSVVVRHTWYLFLHLSNFGSNLPIAMSSPWISASGRGGSPGIYTSTGRHWSTPPATAYAPWSTPPPQASAPAATTSHGYGMAS